MRASRFSKGFSLIEVIIALVVISGSLLVLFGALTAAIDAASDRLGSDNDLELLVATVEDHLTVEVLKDFATTTDPSDFEKVANWIMGEGSVLVYVIRKDNETAFLITDLSTLALDDSEIIDVVMMRLTPAFQNTDFPKFDVSQIEYHACMPLEVDMYTGLSLIGLLLPDFDANSLVPDFSWTFPLMRFQH